MPSCRRCREDFPPETPSCPRCGGKLGSASNGLVTILVVVGCVLGCSFLASILFGRFPRARTQGQLTTCKSNLKNIGTALEMYSTDYPAHPGSPEPRIPEGLFPRSLDALTPNYLKVIPTCPVSGRAYRDGYAVGPGVYTVVCVGPSHSGVSQGENYPQYTSVQGLISQ